MREMSSTEQEPMPMESMVRKLRNRLRPMFLEEKRRKSNMADILSLGFRGRLGAVFAARGYSSCTSAPEAGTEAGFVMTRSDSETPERAT